MNTTQRVDQFFLKFGNIKSIQDVNDFISNVQPLIADIEELIRKQKEAQHQNKIVLNFEENARLEQGVLMRKFKSPTEKKVIESMETVEKTILLYRRLLKRIDLKIKEFPKNEAEKKELIFNIQLEIKELEIQKKEITSKLRIVKAKGAEAIAGIEPVVTVKNMQQKNEGMFSSDGFDKALTNLFDFGGSNGIGSKTKTANKVLELEEEYAAIEKKIIELDRKILNLERFR